MALENILSQEIVQKLGWTLLHFIWQAAAVALLLATLLAVLRKAASNVRYIVACAAMGLIVLLPIVTMQLVPISTPEPIVNIEPAPAPAILPAQEFREIPASEITVPEEPVQHENAGTDFNASWKQRAADLLEPALPYLVAAWLLGVFGLSIWHLGGWAQLQRLKKQMVKGVDVSLRAKLNELSGRLKVKRAVQLLESALIQVPTVVGWLRPVILLPASALTGLTTEQLEALLAHELAHIRRYDYLVNMLQTVAETLGFYHPAVWWVSHKIRLERENCCDDLAVSISGDRIRYARALTSMEEIRGRRGELAVAADGGNLFGRIRRLVGKDSTESSRTSWVPSVITILLIAIIAIPTTLALTIKSESQESQQETEEIDPNSWQEKFYSLYRLEDGQVLKRIAPPFIPERKGFFLSVQPGRYSSNTYEELVSQHFNWDGDLSIRGARVGSGIYIPRLKSTLESVIGLGNREYDIPTDILSADMSGDWIVRKDTPQEELLQALERIVKDETSRDIDFVKKKVETEVIIAKGKYNFQILPNITDGQYVLISTNNTDTYTGGGGGSGTLGRFLRWVGNRVGMNIIDKTEAEGVKLSWRNHDSSELSRLNHDAEPYNQRLDLLLKNLTLQTGLTFKRETATVEKWFISENGTIKAPQKADAPVESDEGRIEGRIIDINTGKGIPGVQLAAVPNSSPASNERFACTSAEDGSFAIGGLQSGEYLLRGDFPSVDVDVVSGRCTNDVLIGVRRGETVPAPKEITAEQQGDVQIIVRMRMIEMPANAMKDVFEPNESLSSGLLVRYGHEIAGRLLTLTQERKDAKQIAAPQILMLNNGNSAISLTNKEKFYTNGYESAEGSPGKLTAQNKILEAGWKYKFKAEILESGEKVHMELAVRQQKPVFETRQYRPGYDYQIPIRPEIFVTEMTTNNGEPVAIGWLRPGEPAFCLIVTPSALVPERQPEPLLGKKLPEPDNIQNIDSLKQAEGKPTLICFWDMNQRPSRNMIEQLAERKKELDAKGIVVLLMHTSDVEPVKLKEWLDNRNILFPCGSIKNDTEKVLFNWGVRAQPWLILTDENGIVRAEGFNLEQLDEKLREKIPDVLIESWEKSNKLLHKAVAYGDIEQVKLLLSKGADAREKDENGLTALHVAAEYGHKNIAELLLTKGADVNAKGSGDWTALHSAAVHGFTDLAELLVAKGADVNAKDKNGKTPLHFVASGPADLAALLISKGADVNAKDNSHGQTPLHSAALDVAEILINKGADINAKNKWGQIPLHCAAGRRNKDVVEILLAKGANVNAKDDSGNTPLHISAEQGQTAVVELLIAEGARVNEKDENDNTPLHKAAYQGHKDVIEMLLGKGAGLNAKNKWGWTPLHHAVTQGHEDVVEVLIANGADVNAQDNNGRTTLWWSENAGHKEIAELLRKHGAKKKPAEDSTANNSSVPLLAKSPAPSGVDKSIVRVDLSVVEVPPGSKMDRETTAEIKNLLADKITIPDSPASADLLRKAAGATAPVKDESAGDKRVTQQQFDKLFDLLVSRGYVKILMRPTLEVFDGHTAKITGTQDSIQITPHVSKDSNIILLQIEAALSSQTIPEDVGQKPIISRRSFASMVLVSPGQSVIIGGVVDMPARPDDKGNAKGSQTPAGELMCIVTASIVAPAADKVEQSERQHGTEAKEPPADKPMIRVYDISDLVGATISRGTVDGMMDGSGDMMGGYGGMGRSVNIPDQAIVNEAQNIVNLIMQTIDPNSWYENDPNAKGIITPFPAERPRKLAINQTLPAHQQIEKLLESQREQINTTQISIELRYLYTNAEFLDEVRDSMNIEFTSNTFLDDKQVETLLRASQKKRDIRSLTAPGVTVLNNETARFNTARHIFMSFLDYSEPNNLSKQSPSVPINTFCRITPHIEDNKNIIVDFVQDIPGLQERIIYDRREMVQSYTETTAITNKRIPNNKTFAFTCDIIKFDQDNQTASPAEKKTLIVLIKPTIIAQEEMPRSNAAAMILNPLRSKGYTAEQTDETIYLKPMPEERPGTDKSQIMIDTKILTASDEFLKYIGLDPNSVARSEGWSDYLVHSTDDSASFVIDKHRADLIIKASATHKDVQVLHSSRMLAKSGMKFETHITDSEHYILVGGPPDSNVFSREPESESNPIELGTTIRLTPTLTPDGKNIELDFEWEYRRLRRLKEHTGPDGKVQKIPIVDVDSIKTPCTVPDGRTLLIAGKKITQEVESTSRVPILGRLPVVGGLFRSSSKITETQTLLILVKPSIDPHINAPPKPKPIDPNDPLIKKLEEKFKRQTKPTN